jgi:HPr kinase/phosphorylase
LPDRFKDIKEIKKEFIGVDFFYNECKDRFKLKKATSKKIPESKIIKEKDLHRPGLALAGYVDLFTHSRVQIFGNTEIKYLKTLSKKNCTAVLKRFFSFDIPCVIVTDNNKIPAEYLKIADNNKVPVFITDYPTTRFVYFIGDFLDDQFSTQVAIHGSFVDVYGVGLLLCGKSGIGKSEITLDLVERGHRLVADDIVVVSKKAESVLMGAGTTLVKHFMEIRGLGIIDIKQIFGIRAIRYQKRVEVIVELEDWDSTKNYDRTGLNSTMTNLLGVDIESIKLPIFPGKNITVIAEVIALNYLCKHYGYNAAKELGKRLDAKMKRNKKDSIHSKNSINNLGRNTEYFEHDFE